MKTKTYKATLTDWRLKVLDTLNMNYEVVGKEIIYKGNLETTFVNFLIDKRIELNIEPN